MKRHGFTVLELLIAIGLMAFFGIVSQRLFVASFHTMQTARSADTAVSRFDHAMLRLRADTWSSTQISADGSSATLKDADGKSIAWRFTESGDLIRTDGAATLTWPDVSRLARFSADGASLILHLPDGFSKHPGGVKLISQLQLASGGAS